MFIASVCSRRQQATPAIICCFLLVLLVVLNKECTAFLSPGRFATKTSTWPLLKQQQHQVGWLLLKNHGYRQQQRTPHSLHRLYFFRKDDAPKSEDSSGDTDKSSSSSSSGGFLDFLSGFVKKMDEKTAITVVDSQSNTFKKEESMVAVKEKEEVTTVAVPDADSTVQSSAPTTSTTSTAPDENKPLDAVERARQLKTQAERLRLEAERMDAELTLDKIARLERELAAAQRSKERHRDHDDADANAGGNDANGQHSSRSSGSSIDKVEEIQREMENLRAKIRGEKPPPPLVRKATTTEPTEKMTTITSESPSAKIKRDGRGITPQPLPFSQERLDYFLKEFEFYPGFMKKFFAKIVELEYDGVNDVNATELAIRMEKLTRMDLSFSSRPMPEFTAEQIEDIKKELKNYDTGIMKMIFNLGESVMKEMNNETEMALRVLCMEYCMNDTWLDPFIDVFMPDSGINRSELVDPILNTLYPKCMWKDGSVEPTMEEVQLLASEVLPKASFIVSERPEKVLGGYLVRGTSRAENGDALVAAIERELAKAKLQDKMNVFYTEDFTSFDLEDTDEIPPILYVTPRDVAREPRKVALSIVTAFGVATSWYLSVYPFLLNNDLMKRVDEQINLADANMAYDLSFLTDLSLPLFVTFMGIQFSHEIGHRVAAAIYNTTLSFPTFVPSLVTGMTSTVTSFTEPPINKNAMFDISLAGPLTGILASLAALVVGSQLTLISDPSSFPALPLEILRQSTLGGGVINSILGNNVLGLPAGVTQAATGMTVALHPVAIAGYFGLVVNSLCLLPIGTTDGGRISLTVFGRGPRLVVGNVFLLALLVAGIIGSDVFLFYYAFVLGFQTGNDIPARNEYDNVSFSRILVAIAAFMTSFLALVPFQN